MSQPAVTITELDGALGVLPPSAGALFALLGVSSDGTEDTPATYARITDLVADFGYGPLIEAAAHYLERYGRPVVVVKTGATTAAAAGAVTFEGTGTSVVTVDVDPLAPFDDYEVVFEVVLGGIIATGPITLRWSLDGGRTFAPAVSLGVATSYTIPNSGVVVNFAAGDLDTGDSFSFSTSAPKWNTTEIGTALDALKNSLVNWELAHVVGDIAGADFDVIDPKFTGLMTAGKYKAWMGTFRMPTSGESEATYLGAFGTAFNSKASVHGMICAGACWLISSVSGRRYRRPVGFPIAARQAFVSHEINIADVNLGSLPGVSLYDDLGNVVHHDESVNPGLDDARATVLRTWDGIQGVYVNRPRILSAAGSDFDVFPHRRVINLAHAALRQYFIRRLSRPVRVDEATGFILEADALEIEAGARAAMRAVLLAKPKASAIQFTLSRTDNLLSTKTMTGTARIVPLAYPEQIELEVGFLNPALQTQAA
jgi:hypothetical protein